MTREQLTEIAKATAQALSAEHEDMVRDAVAAALAAARAEAYEGPDRRKPPLSQLQKVASVLAALAVICGAVVASASFSYRYFMAPEVQKSVKAEIKAELATHEDQVRREMGDVQTKLDARYAPKELTESFIRDRTAKWAAQDQINETHGKAIEQLLAGQIVLQADVKEILRRLR